MARISLLVLVSSLWTLLYGSLWWLPKSTGLFENVFVLIVWGGFIFAQFILYWLFEKYPNHRVYVILVVAKSSLFLIQPILPDYSSGRVLFLLSVFVVFLIDYHIMSLQNKVDIAKDIEALEQNKERLNKEAKKNFTIAGTLVYLLFLYFQLAAFTSSGILVLSLMYWYYILRKSQIKEKLFSIQVISGFFVWIITLLELPEIIRASILIFLLSIVYAITKRTVESHETHK